MKFIISLAALVLTVPLAWLAAREPAALVPASPSAPTTWTIDSTHSSVIFRVKHMGVSNFYGRFNQIAGSVVLDDAKPGDSKVEITIPADSIDTNNDKRDGHLKSPDFFNAAEFPEIKFVSKTVKKDGEHHFKVDGELTMHGVTKPLSVKVEHVGMADGQRGKSTGFDMNFTLKRSDFGMTFMLDGLGDEITVMAGVECSGK